MRRAADSSEAWLETLGERLDLLEVGEVEDPAGAKRALLNLLVVRVEVGRRPEKGSPPSVAVTYRFTPPG